MASHRAFGPALALGALGTALGTLRWRRAVASVGQVWTFAAAVAAKVPYPVRGRLPLPPCGQTSRFGADHAMGFPAENTSPTSKVARPRFCCSTRRFFHKMFMREAPLA